jgi:hypothetical protein
MSVPACYCEILSNCWFENIENTTRLFGQPLFWSLTEFGRHNLQLKAGEICMVWFASARPSGKSDAESSDRRSCAQFSNMDISRPYVESNRAYRVDDTQSEVSDIRNEFSVGAVDRFLQLREQRGETSDGSGFDFR